MIVGLTIGRFLGFGSRDERGSQHHQSNLFRQAVINIISGSFGKDDRATATATATTTPQNNTVIG